MVMVVTAFLFVPMVPVIVSGGVKVTEAVILQATGNAGDEEAPAKRVGPPKTRKLVAGTTNVASPIRTFRRVRIVPPRVPPREPAPRPRGPRRTTPILRRPRRNGTEIDRRCRCSFGHAKRLARGGTCQSTS